MSYLSGIHHSSALGAINPYLSNKIRGNRHILDRVLKEANELSGLGDTEGKVLSFDDVVGRYNKGISEEEIIAWIWYKRKLGVPMKGWEKYYLKQSGKALEEKLFDLVRAGALYYTSGELLPFPIYTYGNMYDRELQLEKDKEEILKHWDEDVFEKHRKAVADAKPEMLSVTNPDEKERPIITAISDFAQDGNLFYITEVREEFMELENAEELKKVNGKIERKRDREKINIRFDGEAKYTLQHVYIKWLFTLNQDTDFEKSSPVDIADYYIANRFTGLPFPLAVKDIN